MVFSSVSAATAAETTKALASIAKLAVLQAMRKPKIHVTGKDGGSSLCDLFLDPPMLKTAHSSRDTAHSKAEPKQAAASAAAAALAAMQAAVAPPLVAALPWRRAAQGFGLLLRLRGRPPAAVGGHASGCWSPHPGRSGCMSGSFCSSSTEGSAIRPLLVSSTSRCSCDLQAVGLHQPEARARLRRVWSERTP